MRKQAQSTIAGAVLLVLAGAMGVFAADVVKGPIKSARPAAPPGARTISQFMSSRDPAQRLIGILLLLRAGKDGPRAWRH